MVRFLRYFLLVLIFLFAQLAGSLAKNDLQFRNYKSQLASSQVECVIQDSYGFIWLGTNGGLHRFDGVLFDLYLTTDDEYSLPHNSILSLHEDLQGNLWIGTEYGIARYDRNNDRFISYQPILTNADVPKSNWIRDMAIDHAGTLWISSETQGLFYYDSLKDTFESYTQDTHGNKLNTNRISCLENDREGNLWIGTFDQGFYILKRGDQVLSHFQNLASSQSDFGLIFSWAMVPDDINGMWIGTKGSGLFHVVPENKDKYQVLKHYAYAPNNHSLLNNEIYALYYDRQGRLWVGNENGGLHVYDKFNDNFIQYQHDLNNPSSLSQNSVRSIYQDQQNRIWVGTSFQGVDVYDPNYSKFKHYFQVPGQSYGLSDNIIRDFHEDVHGNIWIATDGGGLNYWDRKENKFQVYTHNSQDESTLMSNAILGVTEDLDGKLWVTGWGAGVNVQKNNKEVTFNHFQNSGMRDYFPKTHFFDIIRDGQGDIWAANFGTGLTRFDWKNKIFRTYFHEPDSNENVLSTDHITTLIEDQQGRLWLGSTDGGVIIVHDKYGKRPRFKNLPYQTVQGEILYGVTVHQIYEDSKGFIWLATNDGLCKVADDLSTSKRFTIANDLPSDVIMSIAEDDHGKLWLGTNMGMSRFDPITLEVQNFNRGDGLQDNEFSRYAALRLRTGEMVFGGTNGFNIFHPDSIRINEYLPPVYMTSLKVFNKEVVINGEDSILNKHISMTEEIELNHKQSVFSVEYTALNYTRPEKSEYAYRLDGLEEDWNYVGRNRKASYSSLSPGTYTFLVKATNNDGIWNEDGVRLKITILPPWWRTWWALLMYFVLVLVAMFYIIKYRTAFLSAQRKELMRLVQERTSQLEVKNKRIEEQAEELKTFNDSLNALNEVLEEKVKTRTRELKLKNGKLAEYAFINAHNMRVPVANIKGIIQLFNEQKSIEEIFELIELLKGQSEDLDTVLKDIQNMLDKDQSLNKDESRFKSFNKK